MLSNELADLAERVKAANNAVIVSQRSTAESALKAGALLLDAKDRCGHGNWLPFLERAGVHARSATNFMTLARSGLQIGTVSDLGGLKATIAFLSSWKVPAAGEALMLTSASRREENGASVEIVHGPVAYVWPQTGVPDLFHIAVIDENEWSATKRPVEALIEVAGDLPINAIVYWLARNFTIPIADWHVETIEARMVEAVMPENWRARAALSAAADKASGATSKPHRREGLDMP